MYLFLESSETIRETIIAGRDLTTFFRYSIIDHQKPLSREFCEWLIGFSEASFCFRCTNITNTNQQFSFEISKQDPKILYHIKKSLGFGQVRVIEQQNLRFWIFRVTKTPYLKKIFFMLSSNLSSKKAFSYFFEWISGPQNAKYFLKIPIFKNLYNQHYIVDFRSCWLSGFLFENANFIVYWSKNSELIQKFSIIHKMDKNSLNQIALFLKTNRIFPIVRQPSGYQLVISSFFSFQCLFFYMNQQFSKIKSEPVKMIVLKRWWRLFLFQIENRPLTRKAENRLKKLVKTINKIR